MIRSACCALLAVTLAACAAVSPWERETLSSSRMQLDADADETSMVDSRVKTREEGHVGAPGSAGGAAAGGCGCN